MIQIRARYPSIDTTLLTEHFENAVDIARVRTLAPSFEEASAETVASIVEEAARFARTPARTVPAQSIYSRTPQ